MKRLQFGLKYKIDCMRKKRKYERTNRECVSPLANRQIQRRENARARPSTVVKRVAVHILFGGREATEEDTERTATGEHTFISSFSRQ